MAAVLNLLLWLFALDGALGLAYALAGCVEGCGAPAAALRAALGAAALSAALLMAGLWLIAARVPAWLGLPPALWLAWAWAGAMPLPLLLAPPVPDALVGAAQCLVAGGLALRLRALTGGRWTITSDDLPEARRSLRRTAGLSALLTVVLGLGLLLHLPMWLALGMQRWTDGYVSFDRRSVLLEQRTFVAGGRRIDLVAMMHLGEASAYRDILRELTALPGAVVLLEGVTDADDRLQGPLSYDGIAEALGLTPQPALRPATGEGTAGAGEPAGDASARAAASADASLGPPPGARLRHADVDARVFSAETIAFLERIGRSLQLRSPADLLGLLTVRVPPTVTYDLIARRNEHLIGELDAALEKFEHVVIPWGALHLPEVQAAVEARGFELDSTTRRPIIHYATLLDAVLARWR